MFRHADFCRVILGPVVACAISWQLVPIAIDSYNRDRDCCRWRWQGEFKTSARISVLNRPIPA
jgi:hypothetical protein